MSRIKIEANVERMLYSEAMGRCMNPACQEELFINDGDIMEKAHIEAYCSTQDNSFENLVILCPNCHTKFDKLHSFKEEEIREWKRIRKEEVQHFFCKKFSTFEELEAEVAPILLQNKSYFENYFLNENKTLWDKVEGKILVNNRKLKNLFESNLNLFQTNSENSYSNLWYIQQFITHADEFEATRVDEEKCRQVLFPTEINSIFGIAPVVNSLLPWTESFEALITCFKKKGIFKSIVLGVPDPYISFKDETPTLFLKDIPRLRQLIHDYKCFRSNKMRFESLNFVFTCLRGKKLKWKYPNSSNLREIIVNGIKFIFVYEYCLSDVALMSMSPEENSIIVNLHGWNGKSCISQKAYERAKKMKVNLMTTNEFRDYISVM